MDYYDAIKLFNIDKGQELNRETVKKKYRTLVKKWHPDVYGCDEKYKKVQEAYKIINKYLEGVAELQKATGSKDNDTVIISLQELLTLFNGKSINTDNGIILTKNNIGRYLVYIKIEVKLIVDGVEHKHTFVKPRSIKDEYDVTVEVPDTDLDEAIDIKVEVLDKKIVKTMGEIRMNFRFNFNYISQVIVAVQRTESK